MQDELPGRQTPSSRLAEKKSAVAPASNGVASRVECSQLRRNSLSRRSFMDRFGLMRFPSRRPYSRCRPFRRERLDRDIVPFAETHCVPAVKADLAGCRGDQRQRPRFRCADPGRLPSLSRNARRAATAMPARRCREDRPAARPSGLNRVADVAGLAKRTVPLHGAKRTPRSSANRISWCDCAILPVSALARRFRAVSAGSGARRLVPDGPGLHVRQHRERRRAT